jgi:hypothetical protein
MGRRLALLIGNGMYEHFPHLEKYQADVDALAHALRDPQIGAFDDVQELIDQPAERIKQEIEGFFIAEHIKKDDLLLLYLTGHGEIDDKGLCWYFTGINTERKRLLSTAISASFIHDVMNLTNSRRLVLVIDACHASAFFEGGKGSISISEITIKQLTGYGRAILAATSRSQRAWEDNLLLPLSNFTYYLVQGLMTGAADRDQNGMISVDEWFDYADELVREEAPNQIPRKSVATRSGTLFIAYNHLRAPQAAISTQHPQRSTLFPPTFSGQEPAATLHKKTSQLFRVGDQKINVIILSRGSYGPQEIQCFYERKKHLPRDLDELRTHYETSINEQKARGVLGLPYNSPMYKLREFDPGYRQIIEGEEVPCLQLKFGPTDYFSQIVTDLNVGNPVRDRYLTQVEKPITERPVPEFSTILGVNLTVITADNYAVITERSKQAKVAGGKLHTSVGENLLRPKDSGVSWAPDPFLALVRGAQEELGITLEKDTIAFNTFTVIPDFCQYSLIGTRRIPETHTRLDAIWHNIVPADKWESNGLLFCPHTPQNIARFVTSTWGQWFPVALAAVVLSLLDVGYTWEEVDTAFAQARSTQALESSSPHK